MSCPVWSHERYMQEKKGGHTKLSWEVWNSTKAWRNLGPSKPTASKPVAPKPCAAWSHKAWKQKKAGGHTKLSWEEWSKTKAWK